LYHFSIVKGSATEYLFYLLRKFKKSVHNDCFKFNKGELQKNKKYRKNWRKIAHNRDNLNIYTIQERSDIHTIVHWGGDTIEGKKGTGYIFTFVEKMSCYTAMEYILSKSLKETKEKVLNKFNLIPLKKCRSITYISKTLIETTCIKFLQKS
jgi:IS30 family transposase